jgi:hypothetical protein
MMRSSLLLLVGILTVLCTIAAIADDSSAQPPTQAEELRGPLDVARIVVFLPFKGMVCGVGTLVAFPVYVLSGLDPQVKMDTTATRMTYCSPTYLWSPQWSL